MQRLRHPPFTASTQLSAEDGLRGGALPSSRRSALRRFEPAIASLSAFRRRARSLALRQFKHQRGNGRGGHCGSGGPAPHEALLAHKRGHSYSGSQRLLSLRLGYHNHFADHEQEARFGDEAALQQTHARNTNGIGPQHPRERPHLLLASTVVELGRIKQAARLEASQHIVQERLVWDGGVARGMGRRGRDGEVAEQRWPHGDGRLCPRRPAARVSQSEEGWRVVRANLSVLAIPLHYDHPFEQDVEAT
eukprot:scaffold4079_cov129-Isochrysis_galbana.AAC.2